MLDNSITLDFILEAFAGEDYRFSSADQSIPGLDAPERPERKNRSACTLAEVAEELGTSRVALCEKYRR